MPATMQVVEYTPGDPGAPLRMGTRPVPACGPDDVLIEVRAAGVNHADIAQRDGRYPVRPGVSDVLGLEVAGVVRQCGANVAKFRAGDRVCALLAGGGYAQFACVPAVQCLPIPAGLGFEAAGVIPEAYATVWMNLYQKAGLRAGQTLLVHGAGSGVGIAAVQIAAALGARVYGTAGSQAKCDACLEEGALGAINYHENDFETALRDRGVRSVDVVLDMVGGSYFERNMRLLGRDGRMVYIAALAGAAVELDLVDLMRKRITLFGSVLRPLDADRKGHILEDMAQALWPLLEEGRIRPRIFRAFPIAEAEEAHAVMRRHEHTAKMVLTGPPG